MRLSFCANPQIRPKCFGKYLFVNSSQRTGNTVNHRMSKSTKNHNDVTIRHSDLKKSSYCRDTDVFLIDYFSKKKTNVELNSHVSIINATPDVNPSISLDTFSLNSSKKLNIQDRNMLFFIWGVGRCR